MEPPEPTEDPASAGHRRWWIAGLITALVAVLATVTIVFWPNESRPPPPQTSGPVDPPTDESLRPVDRGWTVLTAPEPALSLVVTVANESTLIARGAAVDVTPVDGAGRPLTDPVELLINTIPGKGVMAATAVIPVEELGDVDPAAIDDLSTRIDATAEWWYDAGDIAPAEQLTLSGDIDYRETYDGLSNLEFTMAREADRIWVDYLAIALFRDSAGRPVGGCQTEFNIVGVTAVTRILDCPVPESADRRKTEVFADVLHR
ncbi:hypothetical protein FB566_3071 [Stackebrandtia endophytica]|uniref:Uncharacterized protein n=1 Tax=Stackebrandtia endophytica TaxID=1496996 RepID=A0A543AY59_9ACTN|nr:hypothetical protein [Stackebrandtia endophytica]TQL77512.1 hypothetical protein FB566_3071 [Stackebrandtia endophytica]